MKETSVQFCSFGSRWPITVSFILFTLIDITHTDDIYISSLYKDCEHTLVSFWTVANLYGQKGVSIWTFILTRPFCSTFLEFRKTFFPLHFVTSTEKNQLKTCKTMMLSILYYMRKIKSSVYCSTFPSFLFLFRMSHISFFFQYYYFYNH